MALGDIFRIERDERGWVIGLTGGLFFLTAGSVMLTRLIEAFVIKRVGVEFLPYLHILAPIVVFGGTWLILRYLRGWKPVSKGLLYGGIATSGAFLLAATEGYFTADRHVAVNFLFVLVGVIVAAIAAAKAITKIRNIMSDVLSYEQYERLSPLLSSAAMLGVLMGGLLLSLLSPLISLGRMYALVACIIAVSLPIFLFIKKMEKGSPFEQPPPSGEEDRRGLLNRIFLKTYVKDEVVRRFISYLGVIVGLTAVFARLLSYAIDIAANDRYVTEEALNGFFGTYTAILSLGAIVFIVFAQGRLFERYGLTKNLFTPPVVVLGGVLLMTLYPLFFMVAVAVFIREVVLDIQESAYDSMLEAISDHRRKRAWTWVRSIVRPGFDLVASVSLLGIGYLFLPQGTGITIRVIGVLVLALLLFRILLTKRFNDLYPLVLLSSLKEGDFKTRLRAMEAMVEMKHMGDRHLDEILDVIRDEEEPTAIRVVAFRSVGRIQDPSVLRVVSRFVDHPVDEIRLASLRAIASFTYDAESFYESGFSRHALISRLHERFPEEKDPEAVNAIVDGLLALQDPDSIPFLIAQLKNPSAEVRHSVLHSLRQFKDPAIIDHVRPFLEDPVPHVRSQAVAAIWQFPWERRSYLRKTVEGLLNAPSDDSERLQGYYLVGALHLKRHRKTLLGALDSENRDESLEAAIALLKLGDSAGAEILKTVMRDGSDEAAHAVAGLARHPDVPERQQRLIEGYIHRFHLHYPPHLPVSEPLRIRLKDIPHGGLEGLLSYYVDPEAVEDRRKIQAALRHESFPETKGRVVLAGLSDPWREMAAIALLASGYLVREAGVDDEFDETAVVVADVASDRFPARTVYLDETAEGMPSGHVAKSHYAPSELVTEVEKLSS